MEKIVGDLEGLSDAQLREVLKSVRGVRSKRPKGMSGKEFLARFGGLIPVDEVERMEAAIERDCERIEPDGS